MQPFEVKNGVPQCTLENYEQDFADRHLLHQVVAKWAREKPDALAVINADTEQEITWTEFDKTTTALAVQLHEMAKEEVARLRAEGGWDRQLTEDEDTD